MPQDRENQNPRGGYTDAYYESRVESLIQRCNEAEEKVKELEKKIKFLTSENIWDMD